MALWHSFKLASLSIDNQLVETIDDSVLLAYYPKNKSLKFQCKYFSGRKIKRFGIPMKEKKKLDLEISYGDYQIDLLVEGDEQSKNIKNLGVGALAGAVVAGPAGAAVGAFVGSKRKDCPCKIALNKHSIKIEALATAGYLKEHSKNEFFDS
ncbi:hypothetical protein VA249_07300 [Vibrio alfacsensis]|uniref:hypothetical protein n=1 Tax=Vibrio alfacsensis TaxID=1074311 RepID=UPI001BEE6F30|nr:hypothetical protein [Vibrio alfacsensis]BBM64084.1 hypothetical protein VA249_07300 [Vibrio alfacsensis]